MGDPMEEWLARVREIAAERAKDAPPFTEEQKAVLRVLWGTDDESA